MFKEDGISLEHYDSDDSDSVEDADGVIDEVLCSPGPAVCRPHAKHERERDDHE